MTRIGVKQHSAARIVPLTPTLTSVLRTVHAHGRILGAVDPAAAHDRAIVRGGRPLAGNEGSMPWTPDAVALCCRAETRGLMRDEGVGRAERAANSVRTKHEASDHGERRLHVGHPAVGVRRATLPQGRDLSDPRNPRHRSQSGADFGSDRARGCGRCRRRPFSGMCPFRLSGRQTGRTGAISGGPPWQRRSTRWARRRARPAFGW